jgi:hypothetical protein
MEFTDQEKQFIIQAMDAHVRNNGVNVAGMALVIISKLQQAVADEKSSALPEGTQK